MASFVAGGDIRPSRFVNLDATAEGVVLEADAGEDIYGISHEGTHRPPYASLDDGLVAIAGENVRVYEDGEICFLEIGTGGCTVNGRLKADADGKGVTASTTEKIGAIALETCAALQLAKVRVLPPGSLAE